MEVKYSHNNSFKSKIVEMKKSLLHSWKGVGGQILLVLQQFPKMSFEKANQSEGNIRAQL